MTDYYLTGHDADDVNSYLIADGDGWAVPPALPGATDRVAIAGMRSGSLNVAAVLGYSGNFNPAPNLDSPASISGGTVTASSAPLGLLIGNSSGHTHATVTINGDVGGDVEVTDGDVEVAAVDGDVSTHADGSVTADSVTGSLSAAGGGTIYVIGDVDASDGSVAATNGTVTVGGDIVTQAFTTGDGGKIEAASISGDGSATMMNYLDGGEVVIDTYNVGSPTNSSSRLDILEGAQMTVHQTFCSGRLAGDSDAVNVNGTGSALQLAGKLAVGDAGQGSFTIGSHALVFGLVGLSLGDQKSGRGMLSIDGKGSEFDLTGSLVVGDAGQGTLSLSNGGVISGMDDIALGVQKSGIGTVSIDGKNSGFSDFSGNLIAGDRGQGSLSILTGAQVSLDDVTLGKQQSGQGTITIDGGTLSATGTVTLAAKGKGTLSMSGSTADLEKLVVGASASGDGTLDVRSVSTLKVGSTVTIGGNGAGVMTLSGASEFEAGGVTIGDESKLTVDHSLATIDGVTTIESGGTMTVKGAGTSATLALADISGRLSISDSGKVDINKAVGGGGEITIGEDSTLSLAKADHGVDIRFAAPGKSADLYLDNTNLLDHAIVKGFAKGNSITFANLFHHDGLLGVTRKGANTLVTIVDEDGHKIGALTFAGHYAKSHLHLEHGGTLTTDGPSKAPAHSEPADAATHDDFLFAGQAAADPADTDTPVQYGGGEVETSDIHMIHDHGW